MQKILCVEDSKEFQVFLKTALREYDVTFAETITDALQILNSGNSHFDLVLIDISLPDGNGMKILPFIKESPKFRDIPVIVLSGDGDVFTKVTAFGIGADDYVIKPPDMSELRARIAARLRNLKLQQKEKIHIEFENLRIDLQRMSVELINKNSQMIAINLTPLEFKILCLLVNRPGVVFSREHIIDHIWGSETHITTRTVDAHISHLRSKISKSNVEIETVLSFGYKAVSKTES
jgi:DNA-binding response OmpR family regulator